MSQRGAAKFKQMEMTRSAKAVISAGLRVDRVEVTKDGTISVVARQDNGEPQEPKLSNEWDEALGNPPTKIRR